MGVTKKQKGRVAYNLGLCIIVLMTSLTLLSFRAMAVETVFFGSYPQKTVDINSELGTVLSEKFTANGDCYVDAGHFVKSGSKFYQVLPIEWYIIKDTGASYVLLSRYALDEKSYGSNFWDTCSLRKWLNQDFLSSAFTVQEQSNLIAHTSRCKEMTYDSAYLSKDGKNAYVTTTDNVFLLSYAEVKEGDGEYNLPMDVLIAKATAYADSKERLCTWWLRGGHRWNYGNLQNCFVTSSGEVGYWYGSYSYGVRPCICVSKSAVKGKPEKEYFFDDNVLSRDDYLKLADEIVPFTSGLQVELTAYNAVKIKWNKPYGATKYILYMKEGNKGWKKIKTTTASSYNKKNLSAGKKYSFKVVPVSKKGEKGIADKEVSITTLSKISGVKVAKSSGKAKVTWKKQSYCDGYELSVSTNSSSKKAVRVYSRGATKNKITVTVEGGKKLYYRVRSYKQSTSKKVFGPWSKTVTYTMPKTSENTNKKTVFEYLGAVKNVKAYLKGENNDILISWDGVNGASEYLIYIQKGKKGTPSLLKTVKASLLTETIAISGGKLKEDTQYYFYVVARNNLKQTGKKSKMVAVTTLKKAKNVSIKECGNSKVKISWKKVSNKVKIEGYRVSVRLAKNDTYFISEKTNKTSIEIDTVAGTTFYYGVAQYLGNGYGPEVVKSFTLSGKTTENNSTNSPITESLFKYNSVDEKVGSVVWKYSDSYFLEDATKPIIEMQDLAVLSCLGAAATYKPSLKYEEKFLEACGFTTTNEYTFTYESTSKDFNHGRIKIGYKVVPDGKGGNMLIIAGLINGYNEKGYEWISNFELGDGTVSYHKGFFEASNEILDFINKTTGKIQLLNQVKDKNIAKTKYWLMGHSRGGAITAIVSHRLHHEYGKSQDDIYGFGFATPKMIRGQIDLEHETNIKNILIDEDFVTHVAPENWGYDRYGVDVPLYKNVSERNRIFYLSTGEEYKGFDKTETVLLETAFVDMGKDPYAYAKEGVFSIIGHNMSARFYAMHGLGAALTNDPVVATGGIATLLRASRENLHAAIVTGLMVYDGKITDKFNHAHCMGAYVAAMLAQYGS